MLTPQPFICSTPGQYYDVETGLFYNIYRDCYDPATGRYCQSDPVGLYGGSFSTYTYVNSNPQSYVDPLGLAPTRAPLPQNSNASYYIEAQYNSLLSQIRELRPEYERPSSIGNPGSGPSQAEVEILRNELANLRNPPNQCTANSPNKIIVDSRGNAIPLNEGEYLTGSRNGEWIQVRDENGEVTGMRIDGAHSPRTHNDPRALQPHAHVPGISNEDGTPWLPIK